MAEPVPDPSPSPRQTGLDGLRGLLMVAVIIGHFPTSRLGLNPFGPLPEWIYFIHIPLFLALSCLFVKPFSQAQLGQRAGQILVPYALWMALSHPSQCLSAPLPLARATAIGTWAQVQSVLWFLPALFTTNLLVAVARRPRSARTRLAVWGLLLSLSLACFLAAPSLARWHPRIPFGLDVALFLLPFIALMDLVWRHRQGLAERVGAWLPILSLLALAAGGTVLRLWEPVKTHSPFARRVDFAQFSVPETGPGYLAMALMGVALVLLASRLHPPRWLVAVGRSSMPVFILHYPLLYLLTRGIGLAGESRLALLGYGLAVLALIPALAMAAARLCLRLSPRFALLGMTAPR